MPQNLRMIYYRVRKGLCLVVLVPHTKMGQHSNMAGTMLMNYVLKFCKDILCTDFFIYNVLWYIDIK